MELRHLRYFIAAAEERHFGRAAEKLHVSRPAVSKLIADLEAELGFQLFERRGHNISVTRAGQKLLPDLTAVMRLLTDALSAAKKISEGKSGNLSVGYGILSLHNALFRNSIKKFKQDYPDVLLTLVEIPSRAQPQAMAEGRIDVGFMHFCTLLEPRQRRRPKLLLPAQDESALELHLIEDGQLGVIMEEGHPLARRKSLTMQDLAGERFIVVPNSSASPGYGMLYSLCQQAGFEPRVEQEVDSIGAMFNLVSVGMGVALSVIGKNFSYSRQLRIVPLDQVSYATSFALGWRKGRREPLVDALLETITSA